MSETVSVPAPRHPGELDVLLAAIARGDHGAFNRFYRLTLPVAVRQARRMLGPSALVDDAVQDAYLRVWLAASGYRPANPWGWLATIVTNASLDILRRDARFNVTPPDALAEAVETRRPAEPDPTGRHSEGSLDRVREQDWFSALGERDQRILLLVALGFTNGEIRGVLGDVCHNEVIRRSVRRARRNWERAYPGEIDREVC